MKTSGAWRWLWQTLGALCISTLVACGGGGGGDTTPPVDPTLGSVAGLVVSAETGLPMSGVAVTSGTASTTTAADGTYTLNNVTPGAAVVAFSATNHARGFANATVAAGATASAGVRLTPIGVRQTFAASAGATVSVPGTPAQVSLPAAGIVDRNGAAFSGTVTAELTPINPALDPGNMPGDMTTSVGGTVVPIESFGALTVTLQDASGNRLNLASGSTATVRIPLATRSASPPATVPLFYFNETTGLWVEEGTATLQGTAPNQYYEGTVSHFTTWNADQVANTVNVTGCVQESNAARVANVRLRSDGLDYSGSSTAVTDAGGNFSIAIRRGSRATLAGEIGGRYSNAVEVGPSEGTITLANCLLLGNGTPVFVLQPRSQSVTEGGYVVLQALARGQAPMRYQWQRNGVDIAGATTSALLVDPVSNADQGAVYRAVATNAAGSTPSEDATLTVAALPPAIAVQPAPQSVVVGTNATFTVQMEPQGAPLTYEWRRDGNAISGAPNTASYTLSSAQLADSGAVFSVRITNSVGGVTSNGAALTVTAAPVAPSITQQPQTVSVNVGQTAQFTVVAAGSQPLSYQWRRNGAAIEGAREANYTINAVALSDNGAVFSVVVTNSVTSVASGNATLTVTEPPAGGGYYHVAQSGAPVSGAIVFANGAQTHNSPALVAVLANDPSGGAATVEAAGVAAMLYSPVFEATLSAGQASNVRQRYSFYFKNSRLHRLDQLSPSGTPAGQTISTLLSEDVCGQGGQAYAAGNLQTLMDIADPSRTWVLLRGPGADATCMTADDVTRAVRAGMTSTDAALSVSGTPLLEIIGSNGALSGVIVADGLTLKRLDANLANPTTLLTLGAAASDPFVYGSALPGIGLFRDGNRMYAYKLDGSGGTPTVVVNLTTAEAAKAAMNGVPATGSGDAAYLAIGDGTGTRLLRIGSDLVVTPLGSGPATVDALMATPTRLIITGADGVSSMPLAGGAATVLSANLAMQHLGQVELAGETLYVTRQGYGETGMTQSVLVVQSDGSNAQTLDATAIVGTMMAASVPMTSIIDDNNVYALILAQGVGGNAQHSGATLRAVEGSTRNPLVTYGTLPTATSGGLMVMPMTMAPAQYGQSGLLSLMTFSETGEAMGLMYFDSDVAASLTGITAPVSTPMGARMRPATTRLQPAAVMQRDGLGHVKVIRRTSPLVR